MPYNPAGLFSLVASYFAQPGTAIRTEQHNPVFEDVAGALSSVLLRDGRAPMSGPLNMNGFPITNIAAGNSPSSVATLAQAMPLGAVIDFAGGAAPAGWMLCDGRAISRTTYAALYNLLGNSFGAGDGSTTFNIPDLRGRVIAGPDNMGGTAAGRLTSASGMTGGGHLSFGGVQTVTLTASQIPSITSNVSVNVNVSGNSTRGDIGVGVFSYPLGTSGTGFASVADFQAVGFTGSGSGSGSATSNNTGGAAHTNVQPTFVLNKIIRVSFDG